MIIKRHIYEIKLPNGWKQVNENKPDYYESEDGEKGLYFNYYTSVDWKDDKKIAKEIIANEEKHTKKMVGYKFKKMTLEIIANEGVISGIIDQFDKSKNYRIVSNIHVINGNIFRICFHDYNCEIYDLSKVISKDIFSSFRFDNDYDWQYGISRSEVQLKKARVISTDGFVDIDLYIDNYSISKDGTITLTTKSQLNGKEVGFRLTFDKNWTAQKVENSDQPFYWGRARLNSINKLTENFIFELSKIYEIKIIEYIITDLETTVVGLANNPQEMDKKKISMKFFLNENIEQLYSEVYININLRNRILEFHEKDPEYRKPLIESLRKKT